MKLYDRFGAKGFHTSFATTFGIDFDTYENVCLNRLRGAGCSNNFVMPDAQMLSYALEGASAPPQYAGRLYSVAGMKASSNGVFHGKIFLRLGRKSGELLVGSANMTSPGLAGNREVVGMLQCSAEGSGERRIIAAAWAYLAARLDQSQASVAQQIGWMEARTPWLLDTEPAKGAIGLRDGSQCAFLTNDSDGGIGSKFMRLVDGSLVKRLIIVSPYWDDTLTAVRSLIEELQPSEIVLLIEPKRRLFPVDALASLPTITVQDLSLLDPARFFHAKAIIAQTADADHTLFGSANCTLAALGTRTVAPINQEACLYRRLAPMAAVEALSLAPVLSSQIALKPEDIEPQKREDDLPLSEMEQRDPGRFECVFDTLTWWPLKGRNSDAKIELLSSNGVMLPPTVVELSSETGRRRYRFVRTEQPPSFARLRYADGGSSTLAIVSVAESLRQSAKESRSRKAEEAAAQLSEETNEGYWLLEALDVLETAEERLADEARTIMRARQVKDKPESEAAYRTLDYDEFIEGRHLRSEDASYHASCLGGSDLSLVRGFLNRILGIARPGEGQAETESDEDFSAAFDMGDETTDPQRAIEGGEEFLKPAVTQSNSLDEDQEKKRAQRAWERRNDQREQIVEAIEAFDKRTRQRAEKGLLNAIDVLRLRALITVVAGAGRSDTAVLLGKGQNSLQVFAAGGDDNSWPRLFGRILFIFFGSNRPAIRHLKLDASLSDLSADIRECWATCFWTMQAGLAGARMHSQNRGMVKSLESLAQRLYAVTQLRQSELADKETMAVFNLMSERYGKRLGVDATAIETAHLLEVERLFKAPSLSLVPASTFAGR